MEIDTMTIEELKSKGFSEISYSDHIPDFGKMVLFVKTWGRQFKATHTEDETIDDAAARLWSDFCDFINGRAE